MIAPPEFDWYAAGVTDSPDYILEYLRHGLGCDPDVRRVYPQNGYTDAAVIAVGDRKLCAAAWGGNTGDRVLVTGTGENAPSVASLVRSEWPDHLLIRGDVRVDVDDPAAWDTLYGMGVSLGKKYRLKLEHHGDYVRGENGRTLNIGSRQSPAYARIYEKGHQLRSEGVPGVSLDLVRFEAELKPKRRTARAAMASLSPTQMLGAAPFLTEAAALLLGDDVPRVTGLNRLKRPSDRDRALAHAAQQYRKHFASLRADLGSWCAVGEYLGNLVEPDE